MTSDLTIVHRLNLKLEWAEKHIYYIQEMRDDWRGNDKDRVLFEDDPNTGDRTYKVRDVPPIPDAISLIAGDVIHNIRSALDHIAYRWMVVAGSTPDRLSHVYFPIAENATKYKAEAPGRIEGMGQLAIDAINRIQPYGGGAGKSLWHLHSLDIIDKHKLVLTVASSNQLSSMLPSEVRRLKEGFLGMGLDTFPEARDACLFQTETIPHRFPLKAGDILRIVPKSEVSENMYFPFEIAFGEPPIVAGQSIIETLENMRNFVSTILFDFDQSGLLE